MAHVFYSNSYGGFDFPETVIEEYRKTRQAQNASFYDTDQVRSDPLIVELMFKLGKENWPDEISVREVPDGTRYYIDNYDGTESVVTYDEQEWSVAKDKAE